ncbi:unnamed protein product [Symbiodinium pilosum]|uniref:EF-hand domain-containing protein n=1 Tax=Symbiodinium pilosum TaxID=2952 RepID=A0A812PUJ0_SYMPI|nr:unnamed protein product [Symbiodinium pilosum]
MDRFGDQIAFQSISGDYLSAEGDEIVTRRYCSTFERFSVVKQDTQYAFRAASGKFLSVSDRAPFVTLADAPGDTESFQLFSLMINGVNVGHQLELLDRHGCIMINDVLDAEQLQELRNVVDEEMARLGHGRCPEVRLQSMQTRSRGLAELATHSLVMQLARRLLSPALVLSDMESCRTDVDYVRKELEETTWHVVHPYSSAEFPGVVDPRINVTVTWFLDQLDTENSTWSFVKAPLADGGHLPQLPHLSSPEELQAVARGAQPLLASPGAVWLCIGPYWMSNNVGAASFWKDYDAQTRYKHLSGQKEQSFRALTDAQRAVQPREELCPTVLQATYVREHVATPLAPTPEAGAECHRFQYLVSWSGWAIPEGAMVGKAPDKMDSKKAFEIPGLQARPYHDDELQVAFEIIDLDRHGEIGAADIRRALRLCGESEPTDAEIQEMIRLMDPDGSGSIEFPEFRRYFVDPPPLFRNFDLHRRGGGERDLEEEEGEGEPLPAIEDTMEMEEHTLEGVQRSDKKKKFTVKAAEHSSDPRFKHIKTLVKGGITPEIIRDIYQSFVELDDSDSGYMSFQAFCKVFRQKPSPDMREIFDAFDAEHEGELDLRQFVIGLSTCAMHPSDP